ncbi:MAG: PEP-CTERM sorting domain-containing protein [Planctomycetota bacterium]
MIKQTVLKYASGALALVFVSTVSAAPFTSTWNFDGDLTADDTAAVAGVGVSDLTAIAGGLGSTIVTFGPTSTTYGIDRNGAGAGNSVWGSQEVLNIPDRFFFSFTISNTTTDALTFDEITYSTATTNAILAYRVQDASGASLQGGFSNTTGGSKVASASINTGSGFSIAAGDSATFYIDLNSSNANSVHSIESISISGTAVPEPGSLALMGLGGALLFRRRRACD